MLPALKREIEQEVQVKLGSIFADVFAVELPSGFDDVRRDDTVYWDSISHLRLILELEQIFDLRIPDEAVSEMRSFRQIRAMLIEMIYDSRFSSGPDK